MRYSLITAAIFAAIASTACGGGSESEESIANDETALSSPSTPQPADSPASDSSSQTAESQSSDPSNTFASNTPQPIPSLSAEESAKVAELLGKDSRTSSFLVTLSNGSTSSAAQTAQAFSNTILKSMGANIVTMEHTFSGPVHGFQVAIPSNMAPQALAELQKDPNVLDIEPVRLARATELTPQTASAQASAQASARTVPDLWGLDRIDQASLPLSGTFFSSMNGKGSNVYVIDTGVMPTHTELIGKVSTGANFTTLAGTSDCAGHGTHVASTIAGTTTGVAPAATIHPLRVLDCSGTGTSSAVLKALEWVYSNGKLPGVVNLSLGTEVSTAINTAVANLTKKGFVVTASAGNNNIDACKQSPASAPEALTVASSTYADSRSSFSNFGSCVDLFAPGSSIKGADIKSSTGFVYKSGTSMAAPHVAGAAALLLQASPSHSAAQIAQTILSSASSNKISDPQGSPNKLLFLPEVSDFVAPPDIKTINISMTASNALSTRPTWTATTTLTAKDGENKPLKGVKIQGAFSIGGALASCTTTAAGTCSITTQKILETAASSSTFSLKAASLSGYSFATPSSSSITIQRPSRGTASPSPAAASASAWTSQTTWNASASFSITDSSTGLPVSGAKATFSNPLNIKQTASCTSDSSGKCTFSIKLPTSTAAIAMRMTGISHPILNSPSSSLPTATLSLPAQPTMSASTPTITTSATSKAWTIIASSTILDNNNKPLPGAKLTLKAGSSFASCTSSATGLCVSKFSLPLTSASASISVASLTHPINTPSSSALAISATAQKP